LRGRPRFTGTRIGRATGTYFHIVDRDDPRTERVRQAGEDLVERYVEAPGRGDHDPAVERRERSREHGRERKGLGVVGAVRVQHAVEVEEQGRRRVHDRATLLAAGWRFKSANVG
jgi:hypothetical protein